MRPQLQRWSLLRSSAALYRSLPSLSVQSDLLDTAGKDGSVSTALCPAHVAAINGQARPGLDESYYRILPGAGAHSRCWYCLGVRCRRIE